jgi:hypothetical protein
MRKELTLCTVVFMTRFRASSAAHAMCGVMMQLRAVSKGLSLEDGSLERTSNAAPAIYPLLRAAERSPSLMSAPRAVLMRNADGFILSRRVPLTMPVFSGVRAQ